MHIINRCMTKNDVKRITEKLSRRYGAAIVRQQTNITFYFSFDENCRQIVNYSLPSTKKPQAPLKFTTEDKKPQEKRSPR